MSDSTFPGKISELRQYQLEGVEFLMGNQSALLADEMGLGKTVQVAVALNTMTRHDKQRAGFSDSISRRESEQIPGRRSRQSNTPA